METLRRAAIVVIMTLWTVSIIYTAIDRSYNPPATLHVLMVAVATFLFGAPIVFRKNGEGDK